MSEMSPTMVKFNEWATSQGLPTDTENGSFVHRETKLYFHAWEARITPTTATERDRFINEEHQAFFGDHWCGLKTYYLDGYALVAQYPAENCEGSCVDVFYQVNGGAFHLVVGQHRNIYETRQGYTISTGSSSIDLTAKMAEEIAAGMIVFAQNSLSGDLPVLGDGRPR
jgi:hypothetical protein